MILQHIVHLPFVEMREAPAESSKVVSQALFGEQIRVIEQRGDWFSIVTPDEYTGWVKSGSFLPLLKPYQQNIEVARLSAHIYSVPDTEYGPVLTLPHGSRLHLLEAEDPRWNKILLPDGRQAFVQKGDVAKETLEFMSFCKQFLGLPYTWGGRSSFGYDCSGFVQMVYRRFGVSLPRDARQQILDPQLKPVSFESLDLADLLFWGKSEQEIKHVGIYLVNGEFIHASARENKPYLRISKLSDFEWSGNREAFYPFRAARRVKVSGFF